MKLRHLGLGLAAALLLVVGQAFTQSLVSTRLTDTVDRGTGDVDLFKNVDAATLEAYRSAHGGKLVFGVDINEAANGTEKASSQAVTVADAWLEVRLADGSTRTYGHAGQFWTETQALVAPVGQTARSPYYTLLGESGSSRITSANAIQGTFDSTLKIAVPDSLAGAVSAVLRVRLLDTNVKLGDPEAFYDYTAGFEDLAILTPADARYIDVQVPQETTFRSEAPAMELSPQGEQTLAAAAAESTTTTTTTSTPPSLSWVSMPSANGYYTVAYEDLKPTRGDYDFNDLVIAYRYQLGVNAQGQVERIEAVAYLVARGSTYRHDWTLDLALPGAAAGNATCVTVKNSGDALPCTASASGGLLRWTPFADTVAALPAPGDNAAQPVNTAAGGGFVRGPKATLSVVLASPVDLPAAGAGDPWLAVRTTGQTVHLADRDSAGYPFAMLMASAWKLPQERTDMGLAYPTLQSFVESAGTRSANWYLQPTPALVRPWSEADWAW